ncbi:MAG: hypothetical protein NT001_07635 [Candidatus Woesearchaeota archaeon]|nr:hypothetical protein [Candidatus Woesearchaeota archaeon]
MANEQEKLADRVSRLSAELDKARRQIGECRHEFSQPYQATRTVKDAVFKGYRGHGSDPEPVYEYFDNTEYGWERKCVKCGLTQYTTKSKLIITGHKPAF